MKKEESKTASLGENFDDQQKLVGGNYPWSTPSDLEKETDKKNDKMDPRATTAVNEILNKIDRGPIHLESQIPHPFFKPTLSTLYAKRENQVMIETSMIVPYHVIDEISESVVEDLKSKKHIFQTPVNVIYEEQDRTGSLRTIKSGIIEEYRFTELEPNNGSITATIEGVIKWNKK